MNVSKFIKAKYVDDFIIFGSEATLYINLSVCRSFYIFFAL